MIEFGDLQCPVCKEYSETVIPKLISGPVRQGKARLEFRNYLIIGPQSVDAGAAAIAAGEQGRGWNYVEIFYRNQGVENSGYADDAFLESVARAAGVPDIAEVEQDPQEPRSQAGDEAGPATRPSPSASTGRPPSSSPGRTGPGSSARRASRSAPFEAAISQVG